MTPSLAALEDNKLVRQTLAGDTECFAVLMDRHLAAVRKHIGSIVRNTTDADEVIQDSLLKVWRHLATYRSESSFRTWMITVAINEALQWYRRERRRPHYQAMFEPDVLVSNGESPHQRCSRVEVTRAVRRAVMRLPQKYKEVLVLRDLEELSTRETAQRLQSTIPAVKIRLLRARLLMSAALRRSGFQDLLEKPGGYPPRVQHHVL